MDESSYTQVRIIPESPDSVLFHAFGTSGKARIDFSFMKVRKEMREVTWPLRVRRRREGAEAIREEVGDNPVEKYSRERTSNRG